MAVTIYNNTYHTRIFKLPPNSFAPSHKRVGSTNLIKSNNSISFFTTLWSLKLRCSSSGSEPDPETDGEAYSVGVEVALSMLKFYKREISPMLPKSCRYVPTCSEYSMIAYKKYGVVKGTILTAWRLCRCNPLGGSGFDPPRWFGEERTLEE